ncbi:MAG: 23S rRNA (adenine(2503)-C(2))-methyltransferase RlmN [Phycisphaerae bacterium]|nr:23S rRNA (adenine(2503)-C(2))-methyltransferase RlmN [Phycisphaerae bacterium]
MRLNFLDMTIQQARDTLAAQNIEPYRAEQLADWVYRKAVTDPAAMTSLPSTVVGLFDILTSRVVARAESADGTTKLLLEYPDGQRVETVLIPAGKRATVCLSTQVGCAMGCGFCASGLGGLKRNLTCGEILQQVIHLRQATGRRITGAVFMGMGEPLANYDATVAATRALIDPQRFGLSARAVTLSTVGLPGRIRRLARENLPITLAISLHAPNDALRRKLTPAASVASIEQILAAAAVFFASRKREVTLEYVLLAGLNDTNVCAEALARLAKRLRCNVNLIRYNPVPSMPYAAPTAAAAKAFLARLRRRGVNAHLRRSRGADIAAACGQLRQTAGTGQ